MLDESKKILEPPPPEPISDTAITKKDNISVGDTKGKVEFEASYEKLKKLIPPNKYSWAGEGFWSYPYGEVYWQYYHSEKYRQWNIVSSGLEDNLNESYRKTNASTYSERKRLLDAYILVIKPIKEPNRLNAIQSILNNISKDINLSDTLCIAVAKVTTVLSSESNTNYIGDLFAFGNKNPQDAIPFIDYVNLNVQKFYPTERVAIISVLMDGYSGFFNKNLKNFKESTDLFLPFINQLKPETQSDKLLHYYQLYSGKNLERDEQINQIRNEYDQTVQSIDVQFETDKLYAEMKFQQTKIKKAEYRYKSIIAIGSGILAIVFIGSILAFLSIQRSVRKIENKLTE